MGCGMNWGLLVVWKCDTKQFSSTRTVSTCTPTKRLHVHFSMHGYTMYMYIHIHVHMRTTVHVHGCMGVWQYWYGTELTFQDHMHIV